MPLFVTMGEGRTLMPVDVVVLYGYYHCGYSGCGLIHASWRSCSSLTVMTGHKVPVPKCEELRLLPLGCDMAWRAGRPSALSQQRAHDRWEEQSGPLGSKFPKFPGDFVRREPIHGAVGRTGSGTGLWCVPPWRLQPPLPGGTEVHPSAFSGSAFGALCPGTLLPYPVFGGQKPCLIP